MTSRPLGLAPDELLRQDRKLRDLVRGLVQDSEVDDVVQETWASALARSRSVERPGAWLAVVAANFARRARRTVSRRLQRERAAARPEAEPSTEQTLELFELQSHVIRAVRELSEPYRTTVLLRYAHGLSISAVAEQTGASEPAVRQRLKRGLDTLRGELCTSYRDDWRSMAALAPWLFPGAIEMKKIVSIGVILLVLASGVALISLRLFSTSSDLEPPQHTVEHVVSSASSPQESPGASLQLEAPTRSQVAALETSPQMQPTETTLPSGRVLDSSGQALGDIGLTLAGSDALTIPSTGLERQSQVATTASDGSFQIEEELEETRLVTDAGWVPYARRSSTDRQALLLVAAPAVAFGGTVVDAEGGPLEGVSIAVVGVDLRDFEAVIDGMHVVEWLPSLTGSSGRFELHDLPASKGRLRFEREGYLPREIAIDASGSLSLSITLVADQVQFVVTGRVLTPSGVPLEDALVGLGEKATTRTGGDGSFELDLTGEQRPEASDALWTASPTWQTKVIENVGRALTQEEDGALEYDLVLDGQQLTIAGRIFDSNGAPVGGLAVYPWHRSEVVTDRSAEELGTSAERDLLDVGPGVRVWALSDAEGRFRLEGLLTSEYELRVLDRERFAALTTNPIQAGDESVRITLPADFVRAELSGRIVDLSGNGVADVTVRPMIPAYYSTRSLSFSSDARSFQTDAEGRFVIPNAPGLGLMLSLSGESIMPTNHSVADGAGQAEIELRVNARCHFRVVFNEGRTDMAWIQVLDASGEPLPIALLGGNTRHWSTWRAFEGGRTHVLSVGQSARTLVLYDQPQRELGRRSVNLRPGEVVEIEW